MGSIIIQFDDFANLAKVSGNFLHDFHLHGRVDGQTLVGHVDALPDEEGDVGGPLKEVIREERGTVFLGEGLGSEVGGASACIFSVILHRNSLLGASPAASFLYNLTKNLTVHLHHQLCAVLPYY